MILAQPWGGLGDNLQFSTLPELCSQSGINFYLSAENAYRNREIYDLVWRDNPYVVGVLPLPPNAGAVAPAIPHRSYYNMIGINEMRHGFLAYNQYAKIYYTPRLLEEYKDSIVVDAGSITCFRDGLYDKLLVEKLLAEFVGDNFFYSITTKFDATFAKAQTPNNGSILLLRDLFHYCDIIHSCKTFVCLWSGSHLLSSCIKFHYDSAVDIFCLYPQHGFKSFDETLDKRCWVVDNVKYITKDAAIRTTGTSEE